MNFSTFSCLRFFALLGVLAVLLAVACTPEPQGKVVGPAEISAFRLIPPMGAAEADPFLGAGSTGNPTFPKVTHLSPCKTDAECEGQISSTTKKQFCANLFGEPTCFFPCDPKKGTEDRQNPDCLQPENCVELSDGNGLCVSIPGQLYGIGTYQAVVRRELGDACLIRYGGCLDGLICVARTGSVGTCRPECTLQVNPNSTRPNECTVYPGTACKPLASGLGACL